MMRLVICCLLLWINATRIAIAASSTCTQWNAWLQGEISAINFSPPHQAFFTLEWKKWWYYLHRSFTSSKNLSHVKKSLVIINIVMIDLIVAQQFPGVCRHFILVVLAVLGLRSLSPSLLDVKPHKIVHATEKDRLIYHYIRQTIA